MRVAVIGDRGTVAGFRLAGVKYTGVPESERMAEDLLRNFCEDPEIGIILITDLIAASIRPAISDLQGVSVFPLIVEVPASEGVVGRAEPLDSLIRRAVGIEIWKEAQAND
ncbi:MAG: V-type ATP synthase subunit F [Methanomicrobiaceae archaeon]|nr:V-type ATP synthase subunit F [Methanomicrobiaceae archaeon]